MRPPTFPQVIGGLLESVGFIKTDMDRWQREQGAYLDWLRLQISRDFREITLTLGTKDLATDAIIDQGRPPGSGPGAVAIDLGIGKIVNNGFMKWWPRSEPSSREELVEAVRTGVLPFFESLHSLHGMRDYLERNAPNRWHREKRLALAVTLSRLGEHDKALEILDDPMPMAWRREPHFHIVENLHRWVSERKAAGIRSEEPKSSAP